MTKHNRKICLEAEGLRATEILCDPIDLQKDPLDLPASVIEMYHDNGYLVPKVGVSLSCPKIVARTSLKNLDKPFDYAAA